MPHRGFRRGSRAQDHAVVAGWAAAEATFFFVVPDVWISKVALHRPRTALATTVSAVGAAVAGGLLTRTWAKKTPPEVSEKILAAMPAVSRAMVRRVERDMEAKGLVAMLFGPTRGTPYKLYARAAGLQDVPAGPFAAWSVPARVPRFVLMATLTPKFAKYMRSRGMSDRGLDLTHAVAWSAFYAVFFRVIGQESDAA